MLRAKVCAGTQCRAPGLGCYAGQDTGSTRNADPPPPTPSSAQSNVGPQCEDSWSGSSVPRLQAAPGEAHQRETDPGSTHKAILGPSWSAGSGLQPPLFEILEETRSRATGRPHSAQGRPFCFPGRALLLC